MYQYKAVLKHSKEIVAEGHKIEEVENQIVHYRRGQKYGKHTDMNNEIIIIHNLRDTNSGKYKEKIIKIV